MTKDKFPEPTVGALIFNTQGQLFLMKSHKFHGKYVVPGGHIELGERIEDALLREVKEETDLDVHDVQFLAYQDFIFDDAFWKRKHFIFLDFVCRSNTLEAKLNHEAEEYRWVSLDKVEELPVEPYTLNAIHTYIENGGAAHYFPETG